MYKDFVDIFSNHWKLLIGLWVAVNTVNYMPAPNGKWPTSTWWYKWLFGTLHGTFGMLPRLFALLFPQLGKAIQPDPPDSQTKAAGQGQ